MKTYKILLLLGIVIITSIMLYASTQTNCRYQCALNIPECIKNCIKNKKETKAYCEEYCKHKEYLPCLTNCR